MSVVTGGDVASDSLSCCLCVLGQAWCWQRRCLERRQPPRKITNKTSIANTCNIQVETSKVQMSYITVTWDVSIETRARLNSRQLDKHHMSLNQIDNYNNYLKPIISVLETADRLIREIWFNYLNN